MPIRSYFSGKQRIMLLVAALGYFVDIYDLFIFSAERMEALAAIGVVKEDMRAVGLMLQNYQMAGLIIGGFLFGILADKFGRLKVLFASIILYSLANIANAFVINVEGFATARLIAGIGLAGELGVALSWISENLDRKQRTIATMIVSAIGLLGGVAAALVAAKFDWQTSYILGGIMGLLLLVMRIGVDESRLFEKSSAPVRKRGNLAMLFLQKRLLIKFILCVLAGAPSFVFMSIYVTLAPEFASAFHVTNSITPGNAIMVYLLAFAASDIFCGFLSKFLKARKIPMLIYAVIQVIALAMFLIFTPATSFGFYWRIAFLGFSVGYWGVLITNSLEQFGTNLRATVATSTPNLIRGMTLPATLLFSTLAGGTGLITSGLIVGLGLVLISVIAILLLKDKFENDLNFTEE